MTPRVVVLDYGSGNLRSAQRALVRVGADVTVTPDAGAAYDAAGLVVPGVGAYAACMHGLHAIGGDDVVRRRIAAGRAVLGICVGLQVLFAEGDEHGVRTTGIGAFPGAVTRLLADVLPHMGWNTVQPPSDTVLFKGVEDERFYFVHSYAAKQVVGSTTWSVHGERFVAAVETDVVCGTQFHPEKSADAGAQVLENWLTSLR